MVLNIIISVDAACSDTCASDEYCNNSNCTCNSALYNNTGSNPSPTIDCSNGEMSTYISKCWLERNGYNSTSITLDNVTCLATREIVNDTAVMSFHRPLISKDCGNNVYMNSTHVTFSNRLHIYAKTQPILSRQDVIMNFSCIFPLFINVHLNFTVKPILGSTQITVPGTLGSFTLDMFIYKDADFTTLLTENESVYVESTLYISLIIPSLEVQNFKIKVLDLYASVSESGPTYYLLQDGCPTSGITADLMSVLNNGNATEARFAMKVFQIAGSSTVSLTAKVKICTVDCEIDCTIGARSASNLDNTASEKAQALLRLVQHDSMGQAQTNHKRGYNQKACERTQQVHHEREAGALPECHPFREMFTKSHKRTESTEMPLGMEYAPATSKRMVKLLKGLEGYAAAYLEVIAVFGPTWDLGGSPRASGADYRADLPGRLDPYARKVPPGQKRGDPGRRRSFGTGAQESGCQRILAHPLGQVAGFTMSWTLSSILFSVFIVKLM
ncbi:pancreatic secretory granule membrane major glycoprotein GP2-like [Bufo gargarizans]|uniref:pancreatic secretory granule membrane major glycoprotein GP2-like n=1 Tax=Bufo gargarizans TaxID=30331 RepID=UPI001CF17BC5|nr:pancreatic secretory granule membrane major glycoprotein GP2-like [Bufo gargarizans]